MVHGKAPFLLAALPQKELDMGEEHTSNTKLAISPTAPRVAAEVVFFSVSMAILGLFFFLMVKAVTHACSSFSGNLGVLGLLPWPRQHLNEACMVRKSQIAGDKNEKIIKKQIFIDPLQKLWKVCDVDCR